MRMRRLRLAARRKALGYSQEDLAALLGVATSTVARWEAGACPHGWVMPKLALALQATAKELADLLTPEEVAPALPPAPADLLVGGVADDMKRRDVLGLLAVTGALVPFPDIGSISPRRSISASLVESGAEANGSLWRAFALSGPKQAVHPVVRHQLGLLAKGLEESQSNSSRRQLCLLVGDLYQLAGEIFFDANRYTEAVHCYALAASACREAGEFDMWACALTRHALVEVYERRFMAAAPLLTAASKLAERGDSSLSTRYWVAAVQAEVHAGLGDFEATRRALDTAERVHDLPGEPHNGGWLRFDGSRLAEERGTCYLALGRPDLAEQALMSALSQQLSPRRRGAVLAELAALGAERRDLDRAGHYVQAALELVGRTGSGYIGRKLEAVKERLVPFMPDSRAVELHHKISALGGVA